MEDTTYEGWTNRSTWLVNLWIDNEYNLYKYKVELLKARKLENITSKWVKETAKELLPRGFFNDGGKVGQVNWQEIVESWVEEKKDLTRYE